MIQQTELNDNCLVCKKESYYGVVSISNHNVIHEHYCQSCFLKKRRLNNEQDIVNWGSAPENNQI